METFHPLITGLRPAHSIVAQWLTLPLLTTAGNATLIADPFGLIKFFDDPMGDSARIEVFGSGSLDITADNAPGVTVGSIEGNGLVQLGANNLTAGITNLSPTFSGTIDGAGSLTKTGTAS